MQQLLEVLQDQVRKQVDVNATQMLELIGQLLQTVSALPVPAPLILPGMCECMHMRIQPGLKIMYEWMHT